MNATVTPVFASVQVLNNCQKERSSSAPFIVTPARAIPTAVMTILLLMILLFNDSITTLNKKMCIMFEDLEKT